MSLSRISQHAGMGIPPYPASAFTQQSTNCNKQVRTGSCLRCTRTAATQPLATLIRRSRNSSGLRTSWVQRPEVSDAPARRLPAILTHAAVFRCLRFVSFLPVSLTQRSIHGTCRTGGDMALTHHACSSSTAAHVLAVCYNDRYMLLQTRGQCLSSRCRRLRQGKERFAGSRFPTLLDFP